MNTTNAAVGQPDHPLLVDTTWLAAHLDDPDLRIVDVTTFMTPQPVGPSKITSGRPDYDRAHIPGAIHLDMVDDLSAPDGRYPYTLPSPQAFAALLSRLGIANHHHVVLYGGSQPIVVTRSWWVFTTLGHDKVSILDGGFDAWRDEGRPVTTELPSFAPVTFTPRLVAGQFADADDVARLSQQLTAAGSDACNGVLVNALMPEQFDGSGGAHYGRRGRIPGSVNVSARDLVDYATKRWQPLDEIQRRFAAAGVSDRDQPVICYCGGGIAATVTFFALRRLGHRNLALYDNSLLEWAADPARPMENPSAT